LGFSDIGQYPQGPIQADENHTKDTLLWRFPSLSMIVRSGMAIKDSPADSRLAQVAPISPALMIHFEITRPW
jgi:hypothetical protein